MTNIDTITLILGAATLFLALVAPMMSPLFRRLRQEDAEAVEELPKVTVLLVSNVDHVALDEHHPIFLTQVY
jgi:hypothetical protein